MNTIFWNCMLRWVPKHRLRRLVFLNCIMFLKFHIHTIHIKASIFKILTWNSEEIILLNKYYKVFHCPMFSWERYLDLREELLSIYWKIRATRTLYTMQKTKYFIHVSCREKIDWSEIPWLFISGWRRYPQQLRNVEVLQKLYPSHKSLRWSIIFFSLLTEYSTPCTLIFYIYRNWRP